MLKRVGAVARVRNLEARGAPTEAAIAEAAKTAKGGMAELDQANHLAARAGALGHDFYARVNPVANDPLLDVQFVRDGSVVAGAQLKTGRHAVGSLVRRPEYGQVVASAEAREPLVQGGFLDGQRVSDRLAYEGVEAPQLTAAGADETTRLQIRRVLVATVSPGWIDHAVESLRAGTDSALSTAVLSFAIEAFDAHNNGRVIDFSIVVQDSARAFARTTLQTQILLRQFVAEAGPAFSAQVLHRVAASALKAGAIADIVIETARDLWLLHRQELTLEEVVRRFGLHVTTAAGGAGGAYLALRLTEGAHPIVRILALLLGGHFGAKLGRGVGEWLFLLPPVLDRRVQFELAPG
jgi:hypothetical protein